jgi:hypothetical protein
VTTLTNLKDFRKVDSGSTAAMSLPTEAARKHRVALASKVLGRRKCATGVEPDTRLLRSALHPRSFRGAGA